MKAHYPVISTLRRFRKQSGGLTQAADNLGGALGAQTGVFGRSTVEPFPRCKVLRLLGVGVVTEMD